jgi:apolipoprotein N-acyltransferase
VTIQTGPSTVAVTLAGVVAVAAFAPFGWYPLAVIALAVLFSQWSDDTPRRAMLHGALFGAGFFGAGISWVYISVNHYGHVHPLVAGLVTALLVAFLSLYPALLGYLLKRLRPVYSMAALVAVFPAAWVLSEWLRGWLFSGFPWLSIGTSQIDGPLGGFAPVVGVPGISLIVGISAALLVALLRGPRRLASLLVLAAIWLGGQGLRQVEWTQPRGEALEVALVQGNIAQERKWDPGNLMNTLARYTALTFEVPGIDLYVWPETAIPAFHHQVEEDFLPHLETQLREHDAALLSGIPVLDRSSWEYYNAIVTLGDSQAFYYKQHLVPFGEYLPLRWLIGSGLDALAVPNADFSAGGKGQTLLTAAGVPVSSSICFEVVFGEQIIRDLPEAALLVNVSNDAWFGDSLAPHQHLEMARMRARETGRPMLRATNTGISAVIDQRGEIIARSEQFETAVVTATVTPRQGATPYVRMGNWPALIVSVLLVLLPLVAGRWRRSGG